MPQVGTLLTGAGVDTTIAGQASCGSMLVLGDVDTANPLTGFQVEIDGTPYVNIKNNATLCSAFAKWQMETISGTNVIGIAFKCATGKINRNTTYRLTNGGATTPIIRVLSNNRGGVPVIAAVKGIAANASDDFSKFAALMIDLPANVNNIEIAFKDGHKETWTVQDADAVFALKNQAEADGRLAGSTIIDNSEQNIASVRINATTAISVLVVKLPNDAFQRIQRLAKRLR